MGSMTSATDPNDFQPEPIVDHAPEHNRYEIREADELAGFAEYVDDEHGRRILFHTEVDPRFSGRGLAGKLVTVALEDTRRAGLRIVPVCPYVKKFVSSDDSFDDIVDKVTPQVLQDLDRLRRG